LLIAAFVFTFSGMLVDAAPFAPTMPQPDYTVVMVQKSLNQEDARRTVTHHGHWTRIDQTRGAYQSSEYYSAASGTRMIVSGQRSVSLERKTDQMSGIDFQARNTGERQTELGESCTVWDVWRTRRPVYGSDVSYLSCVTDDGIALWDKTLHGSDVLSSTMATRIERRPIAPEEVQPPPTLLTLDWWSTDVPSFDSTSTPDHEIVMALSGEASGAGKSIRTMRRLGPWQFRDEIIGSRRWIEIAHDSLQMRLRYESDASGEPRRLTITRPGINSDSSASVPPKPMSATTDLNRSETILGERCRWFNMMPDVMDAGRRSCLTSDGMVLKEVLSGRGMREQEWNAVRFTRRPIRLDEIKPPAELLDPQFWGLN
jgi:hypothetical protein